VIECDVFRIAGGGAEAAGAQHTRNAGECRNVLGVVPSVERGLDRRGRGHSDQQQSAGTLRRRLIAGQDLIALEA
jgi:hypothetical protein